MFIMGIANTLFLGFLFLALGVVAYLFVNEINVDRIAKVEYEAFAANITAETPKYSNQFYPNLRFEANNIPYYIEAACDDKKRKSIKAALETIASRSIILFHESGSGQGIQYLCSQVASVPEQQGHFVAGEGGPTKIINASQYYVIEAAQVGLYRPEKCESPQIAMHETFHALGFDHNSNENSIMYPVTGCQQQIDSSLIEELNRLYSAPSLPDIVLESVEANKTGRYLSFSITIANYGLANASSVSLEIVQGQNIEKTYDLQDLSIGRRKVLTVGNLHIAGDERQLIFRVKAGDELNTLNNEAVIAPIT